MTTIKPGQVYRDNDPRNHGERTVTVLRVPIHEARAWCESVSRFGDSQRVRRSWIALKSLHTDGKPRRTGFSLVEESK